MINNNHTDEEFQTALDGMQRAATMCEEVLTSWTHLSDADVSMAAAMMLTSVCKKNRVSVEQAQALLQQLFNLEWEEARDEIH